MPLQNSTNSTTTFNKSKNKIQQMQTQIEKQGGKSSKGQRQNIQHYKEQMAIHKD